MNATVAGHAENVGPDAMRAATGRTSEEWFAVLDAAGAVGWTHKQIVRELVVHHGVDPWWCQGITVGYEQARGIRKPGQRQNGLFEVSASRTLHASTAEAQEAIARVLESAFGRAPDARSTTATYPTVRFALPDGEKLLATVSPVAEGRARVTLTHSEVVDGDRLAGLKDELRGLLARLDG